eukprot:scaffold12909_cov133-Skeletonema_marinoi.AAC.12
MVRSGLLVLMAEKAPARSWIAYVCVLSGTGWWLNGYQLDTNWILVDTDWIPATISGDQWLPT